MEMTNKEIVRRYLDADKKKSQLEILADLNGTDTSKIKEILIAEGVMKKTGPKGPRKLKAVVAAKAPTAPEEQQSKGSVTVSAAVMDAAHLGVEFITMQIREMEEANAKAQKALDDLKKQRMEMLKAIHSLHADNDGNLWYYGDDGKAVVVNE